MTRFTGLSNDSFVVLSLLSIMMLAPPMVKSQGIQISEKYLQPTRLVLTESFTSIGVLPGIRQQPDMSNLITYLAVLSDASGMKGQLLFQLNPDSSKFQSNLL